MKLRFLPLLPICLFAVSAPGAITVSNLADKTKYDAPRTFTVTADPNAATTTATLDGLPTAVGVPVTITGIGYHELVAESRTANGTLVDSQRIRFITRDPARLGTEDGIPPHTPFASVNDAPSAFEGQTLKVIAPAAWPAGVPIPIAAVLRNPANEPVRLNGTVRFAGLPRTTLQLRRGWGSVIAPAVATAGPLNLAPGVNELIAPRTINIEAASTYTNVSGTIASSTTWPANSRIRVTGNLTINAGATLTVGPGTIVQVYTGTGSAGSAAEIIVNGTLQVNGTETNPVAFGPATTGQYWGGIELPAATSILNASHTIFTGAGEDPTWFDTNSGYSSHRAEQALFLISGSAGGTAIGAQLHLTDCYCFSLAGQEMNSQTNTWIDLQRTLMQRAITCGELNGSKVTIDRSALIEFPSEDAAFADADNDVIYLTNGDLSITNSVLGFCKDDGVDSGGNGGNNPFTAAADVTPFVCAGNWFEGTFHEGNSLSGTRNVTHTGNVFLNCGQGVEDGYSAASTADGPNVVVDGCLFVSNMVGVRWGDNYGSGYSYNGSMEVRNSLILNSFYRDAFAGQWHPTQANAWIYHDASATNSFGRPYFNVHDNFLSQPDPVRHPANTPWNPANPAHAAALESFMPVPGSAVGVAVSSYQPVQNDLLQYPGLFTVRLSTFSSRPVTVDWSVVGKNHPADETETVLGSGALSFAPGETLKTIDARFPGFTDFSVIHVALANPVNAEVTGEAWFFKSTAPDSDLVPRGASGWRFRQTRSEPPAAWKQLNFDDTTAEWLPCTLPAGFDASGIITTAARGPNGDITQAFYFRKRFTVSSLAAISEVTLRIRRDDAAVVWLNNDPNPTVVSADGTFNGPYTYAMTAAGGVPASTNINNYLTHTIPVSKLVTGTNIIAIELHQSTLTSSDLVLDCELVATYAQPFELHLTRAGGKPVLYWFDPAARLEETTDFSVWTPRPGAQSPFPFDLSGTQRFFRLRR